MSTPDLPEPRDESVPAHPLSEHERAELARLEAGASADDPGLSARMARPVSRIPPRVLNGAVQAAVVLAVALAALPSGWAAVLLVLAVVVGATVLAIGLLHAEYRTQRRTQQS